MSRKKIRSILVLGLVISLFATGCGAAVDETASEVVNETVVEEDSREETEPTVYEGTEIALSDTEITVDGEAISTNSSDAVYTGANIVYYEA